MLDQQVSGMSYAAFLSKKTKLCVDLPTGQSPVFDVQAGIDVVAVGLPIVHGRTDHEAIADFVYFFHTLI